MLTIGSVYARVGYRRAAGDDERQPAAAGMYPITTIFGYC